MDDLTLLITTHNRGDLLRNSLERLRRGTFPAQVLVIDDGGDDNTAEVCWEFVSELPIEYVYHDNPGHTLCAEARNVGLKMTRTPLLITSEPEVIFETDAIAQLQFRKQERPEEVISAGHVQFVNQSGGVEDAYGWVAPFVALYEREWLMEVGGWDEGFPGPWGWDDTDLLTRLRMNGHGQHIDESIRVRHQWHGGSLGDANHQNENYWRRKSFHSDWNDKSEMVANLGKEWGRWKPRATNGS